MTSTQLTHLLIYLRISSLLPLLNMILDAQSRPTPTATLVIHPPATRVIYQRSFRIRLPRVPASVLAHIFFSAVKVLGIMWMLTRDMRWDDVSLWIIGGGAIGWWLGDAMNRYHQERRQIPTPVPAPAADAAGNANVGGPIPAHVAAEAPIHAGAAARANRQRMSTGSSILTSIIPLVHLDTDARQLRLPISPQHQYMGDPGLDRGRAAPIQPSPPWWKTQVCLPILLWIVTLIPEWEALRARAIRRRERAMRVLVGELSTSAEVPSEEGQDPPRILPEGLSSAAKAYYERVMERGEGIDWEEEREAQRALGVVQDEPADGGLGLRML